MVDLVDTHNYYRQVVSPPAAPPLLPLIWDPVLANDAQTWASACFFDHGGRGVGYTTGQNIYAAYGYNPTPLYVANAWGEEYALYDYASNSCQPGADCGHYTQMIWHSTTSLGCGRAVCDKNSPFGDEHLVPWIYWVCNYYPAGNVYTYINYQYVEERPYTTNA
jgi:pathogenesis-related protein 1